MNFCKEESASKISFPLVRVFWYNKDERILDVRYFSGAGTKSAESTIRLRRARDLNISGKLSIDDENAQKIIDFIKTKTGLDSYLN